MATLLDTGFLGNLEPIMIFLLVFFLAYAGLTKSKLFENPGINSILAFVIAGITLFFKPALVFIHFTAPWFILTMVVLFFFILAFLVLGVDTSKLLASGGLVWTIITIGIIITLFGLAETHKASVEECSVDEPDCSNYSSKVQNVLFSPQVAGMLLIFIIAGFAIIFLVEVNF